MKVYGTYNLNKRKNTVEISGNHIILRVRLLCISKEMQGCVECCKKLGKLKVKCPIDNASFVWFLFLSDSATKWFTTNDFQ